MSLRGSWFGINRIFRDRLRSFPITPVQYTVLRNLFENQNKSLSQRTLARLISSNENNMASIIRRLEDLDLVTRADSPEDRRKNMICISPGGERVFLKVHEIAKNLRSEFLSCFDSEEVSRLSEYLMDCAQELEVIQSEEKGHKYPVG